MPEWRLLPWLLRQYLKQLNREPLKKATALNLSLTFCPIIACSFYSSLVDGNSSRNKTSQSGIEERSRPTERDQKCENLASSESGGKSALSGNSFPAPINFNSTGACTLKNDGLDTFDNEKFIPIQDQCGIGSGSASCFFTDASDNPNPNLNLKKSAYGMSFPGPLNLSGDASKEEVGNFLSNQSDIETTNLESSAGCFTLNNSFPPPINLRNSERSARSGSENSFDMAPKRSHYSPGTGLPCQNPINFRVDLDTYNQVMSEKGFYNIYKLSQKQPECHSLVFDLDQPSHIGRDCHSLVGSTKTYRADVGVSTREHFCPPHVCRRKMRIDAGDVDKCFQNSGLKPRTIEMQHHPDESAKQDVSDKSDIPDKPINSPDTDVSQKLNNNKSTTNTCFGTLFAQSVGCVSRPKTLSLADFFPFKSRNPTCDGDDDDDGDDGGSGIKSPSATAAAASAETMTSQQQQSTSEGIGKLLESVLSAPLSTSSSELSSLQSQLSPFALVHQEKGEEIGNAPSIANLWHIPYYSAVWSKLVLRGNSSQTKITNHELPKQINSLLIQPELLSC